MIRILVLDDNPEVRYGIYDYLKKDYEVYITKKENEVFNILNQTNINLIIFDYSTVSLNLRHFISKIKEANSKISILVTSELLNDNDKKYLFESNIDDYIEKPIDMTELGFRIEHLLKNKSIQYKKIIETENLQINCDTQTVTYQNESLNFFSKEFQILYHLLSYPNKIFTKSELVDLVCDTNEDINEEIVRAYISLIRNKIKPIKEIEIVTIKGIGYKGVIKK